MPVPLLIVPIIYACVIGPPAIVSGFGLWSLFRASKGAPLPFEDDVDEFGHLNEGVSEIEITEMSNFMRRPEKRQPGIAREGNFYLKK